METYWAAQRSGMLNGQSGQFQQQSVLNYMGNVCTTYLGRSGPGPLMPIGSQCFTWDACGRSVGR